MMRPIGERVIARDVEKEAVTESGIVLPDAVTKKKERAQEAIIVASNVEALQEGDRILYNLHGRTDIEDGLVVVRECDVLAIIEGGE